MIHKSHDLINVSDLTMFVDCICRNCDMKDDELENPCTNPKSEFVQYVMRFPDGKYEPSGIKSKLPFYYREKYDAFNEMHKEYVEKAKVSDINQARVYVSLKSCQSGNAWGWGARPVPVRIQLVEE